MLDKNLILKSTWSDKVANDPKHRPQFWNKPSTTVRREWCRRPQEAHIGEPENKRYRRLSVAEIAVLQGFPYDAVDVEGISEIDKIAALGNAVPPIIGKIFQDTLLEYHSFEHNTIVDICAGIGGLSMYMRKFKHIALIEMWPIACDILRTKAEFWDINSVYEIKVEAFDFNKLKGVGILCGGPPCQPWSLAGEQKGVSDERDLLSMTPRIIAECEPEVFLFENVPGLVSSNKNNGYFGKLLENLSTPRDGLEYGVGYVSLNLADYGLPQIRKRIFILGVKNHSFMHVEQILSTVETKKTHSNNKTTGLLPWVTLKEALNGIPNNEVWRQWNIIKD